MGAAVRFAFAPGGPLGGGFAPPRDLRAYRQPAPRLRVLLSDRRTMTFVVLWFAANFLFGAVAPPGAEGGSVAWEAHIGGFLAGFLGFRLFDRGVVPPRLTPEGRERLVASEAILSLMDALRRPVPTLIARASTQSAAG